MTQGNLNIRQPTHLLFAQHALYDILKIIILKLRFI